MSPIHVSELGYLSLASLILHVTVDTKGCNRSHQSVSDLLPSARWIALMRALMCQPLERQVLFVFMLIDQSTSDRPVETSARLFQQRYECPVAETTRKNIRRQYCEFLSRMYRSEARINADLDVAPGLYADIRAMRDSAP